MNYLRDGWYVASWSQDLGEGKPLPASVLGEPLVLWRAADGVHALEDRCVHRLEIPGQAAIPPNARVRAYPVIDRHSWLWVWMPRRG